MTPVNLSVVQFAFSLLKQSNRILQLIFLFIFSLLPFPVLAAGLPAHELSLWWCFPFIGLLLSIALCPILIPKTWHSHSGKIIGVWCAAFLIPLSSYYNVSAGLSITIHALLEEYIPFMLLLLALYTLSGGILIQHNGNGSVKLNVLILAAGTLLAGIMGTTGAAMLFIRPLLRANAQRRYRTHLVVFFIFLVANIGGGLTPLGDPPLFLGFLKGVGFQWTFVHMLLPVIINTLILLFIFFCIDYYLWQREIITNDKVQNSISSWSIQGKANLLLLFAVTGVILVSGLCKNLPVRNIYGIETNLVAWIRDGLLLIITLCSLKLTPAQLRRQNDFNWAPMVEVGKLFIGIFITIAPVMAILQLGQSGSFGILINLIEQNGEPVNTLYFWLSGLLSGFLDNAPTYLVFFNLAGGDAALLMQHLPSTLMAVSMGSVFMGALSYIGNAPNLMVKSIAEQHRITMPSFFGYMGWSVTLLIPVFLLDTLLFF
ncbi:sodium:proton antiporter [Snodgrassella alvi]|uniref:sodium:proton antiporter n=1 Tax=Snodgrassella alvi TaxID=1196083 RepID=UPI000A06A297|nr:sodium:proton antiporter [Snodgrassella alvi]ORF26690.1 sodium:proton antiporter [Snodgrassella alvi]ORF32747.1 sodium:proton antiporter [Snodgrassella alvi]ORF35447.1 sodium:proton antiporter [Snodgrassella alvi]ORF39688.1 sodium:proton antiporter [Snodgrassella alvi]ORF41770.1 sodium:proton antiporter [Snodgrassella alvi]